MVRKVAHRHRRQAIGPCLVDANEVTTYRIVGVESFGGNRYHLREVDNEQTRYQHTSLMKALVDGEPIQAPTVVQADTESYAIVELAGDRHQLARYAKTCQYFSQNGGIFQPYAFCRSMKHA